MRLLPWTLAPSNPDLHYHALVSRHILPSPSPPPLRFPSPASARDPAPTCNDSSNGVSCGHLYVGG